LHWLALLKTIAHWDTGVGAGVGKGVSGGKGVGTASAMPPPQKQHILQDEKSPSSDWPQPTPSVNAEQSYPRQSAAPLSVSAQASVAVVVAEVCVVVTVVSAPLAQKSAPVGSSPPEGQPGTSTRSVRWKQNSPSAHWSSASQSPWHCWHGLATVQAEWPRYSSGPVFVVVVRLVWVIVAYVEVVL